MNSYEQQYLKILDTIIRTGRKSGNRTGINTYKIWGAQMHIDLNEGFPFLTTKKMFFKMVFHELMWMLKGDTNIRYLLKNNVTFWTEWPLKKYNDAARELKMQKMPVLSQKEFETKILEDEVFAKAWGSIGKYGYGGLWANFPYVEFSEDPTSDFFSERDNEGINLGKVNQIINVINDLKTNPDSRRIIISAWHPYHSNQIEDALLPACHHYIQFGTEELTREERIKYFGERVGKTGMLWELEPDYPNISEENLNKVPKYRLNCYYNMRSNDFFLGNPYNNAFYALFTHLMANEVNMVPGKLVYSAADVHLYENHIEQSKLQLTRQPRKLPILNIKTPSKSIFDMTVDDVELINYDPHPTIKADVAV